MDDRETIFHDLRNALPELKRRYPIRSLGVFGSLARGDARADSDVDILVEFDQPVDFFAYYALEQRLGELAGRPVDLVTRASLKRYSGQTILRDLVPL
jgi:predicted nucleotidyltransferase